jgi:flagellar motor protein MotB
MFDAEPSRPTTKDHGTFVVFLSLYLLLLAFFIILYSISTFEEERTAAALGSVTATFATSKYSRAESEYLPATDGTRLAPPELLERTAELVKTAFPVAEVEVVTPNRVIEISLPTESLFFEGEARLRPEAAAILRGIADLLGRHPPGLRYETEILVGSPWTTERDLKKGQTLEIARAGAFARELGSHGLPGSRMAVGLNQGEPERVRLLIHVRSEDDPKVDFRQIAP